MGNRRTEINGRRYFTSTSNHCSGLNCGDPVAAAADGEKDEGAGGDTADAASGEGTKKKKKKGDLEAEVSG